MESPRAPRVIFIRWFLPCGTLERAKRRADMRRETVKTHLILANAEDLRREELAAYHAVCRTLDREARKLKTYEDDELPGFLTWVQNEFAEELAQVHEWTAMMRGLEQLIDDVD